MVIKRHMDKLVGSVDGDFFVSPGRCPGQWLAGEQVEEAANRSDLVHKLNGDSKGGVFMLDRLLGERKAESE